MGIERQFDSPPDFFLGVDGGGTKTQALIGLRIGKQLEIIGAGQGGPSNPRSVGFDQAFANITKATHAAFATAGIQPQACSNAVLCLAGAGREQERTEVERWALQSRLARKVSLVSEAEAVLAAARVEPKCFPESNKPTAEVALISGTGSLAWGRVRGTNSIARSGGWGYLLGDEGSGFWLGQQLLQVACRSADHRQEDPLVLERVLRQLEIASATELVPWCYSSAGFRERIASIAPLVFELQHVQSVSEIVANGVKALAEMIVSVIQQLGCSNYELAIAGSVAIRQQEYRESIITHLGALGLAPLRHSCVEQPVHGALYLAANDLA